jgi:integrase/recombinase XerD
MNWDKAIRQFRHYLQLERSLSANSVEAYERDVEKFRQYLDLSAIPAAPVQVTADHITGFLQYIGELGLSAYSQARMLSGLKAFYRYLLLENLIHHDPSYLIEGPRLGRKLPDVLTWWRSTNCSRSLTCLRPKGCATGPCSKCCTGRACGCRNWWT